MADILIAEIETRYRSGVAVHASLRAALPAGSILVLFGPSGSGKTTVLRSIAGLDTPHRGTIQFGGAIWFDAARRRFVEPHRRAATYVSQAPSLFPHLTVSANVAYGLGRLSAGERSTRLDECLEGFDLAPLAGRYPRQLSGGQAQRVSLARALAGRPRLLLLDEPFAALDAPARRPLGKLLRAWSRRLGTPVVLVTHDRNDAMSLGDEMAVLADGRVRQVGPVAEIFRRPADLSVARAVGVDSVLPGRIVRFENGVAHVAVDGGVLRAAAALEEDVRDVFACIRAEDVTLARVDHAGSARNHLRGRVTAVDPEGAVERVTLDCGFPLAALVTREAREELRLAPGVEVAAVVKATAIHLVPRSL